MLGLVAGRSEPGRAEESGSRMTVLVVCEKPSAAKHFAEALGGMSGTFEGTPYQVTALRGHLYEFADPADQVPPGMRERVRSWDLSLLPWDETQFAWKRVVRGDAASVAKDLKAKATAPGIDEVVCATDLDPSGEGALLFAEPLLECGIRPKRLTRMYFTDEAVPSIQKAFRERKPVPGNDVTQLDEYRKAITRARFDFLTQQHTRIASECAGQRTTLRQGRLKSAMLLLVGDQLAAYDGYVRTVKYQDRFRDENGVLYTDPDQPQFATQAEADVALAKFRASPVVVDSKVMKSTPPPKLLDLAALSSRLGPKGFRPADVLKTYQAMYEAQAVSYPRTEDRTVTPAQFDEMLPLVERIAGLVGVDTGFLTHRSPRSTHVKDGGAHGANRPGPKVPASMSAVERDFGKLGVAIYAELARSFLAMLAEHYRYEAQSGHVQDFPSFRGKAAVPAETGWKAVFSGGEEDEDENPKGLGTRAQPCVFEVVPKRPEHPTMAWLMKQLEKWDVGTGATRTSTYAELTKEPDLRKAHPSASDRYPLMVDTKGRTTLTEFGEQAYRLLPGTRIGDLEATAHVYQQMRDVAEGRTTTEAVVAEVAEWVRHDIEKMRENAVRMQEELGLRAKAPSEKCEGEFAPTGASVSFSRTWAGHRFTDVECEALLAGKTVAAKDFAKKAGGTFEAYGKLDKGSFKGSDGKAHDTFGFQVVGFGPAPDANGKVPPPSSWCGHEFTPDERDRLADGEAVTARFTWKSGKSSEATVRFLEEDGRYRIVPQFDSDLTATPSRHLSRK